jgi:hypothetical protein
MLFEEGRSPTSCENVEIRGKSHPLIVLKEDLMKYLIPCWVIDVIPLHGYTPFITKLSVNQKGGWMFQERIPTEGVQMVQKLPTAHIL